MITAAERAVAFPRAELEDLPTAELLRELLWKALGSRRRPTRRAAAAKRRLA